MVLRRGLELYRDNLVLTVPPLVSMLISFIISASWGLLVRLVVFPRWASPLLAGLVVGPLVLVVGFVVLVGQVGMSGKVVSEGRTGLAEWVWSIERYSSRVLGIMSFT